ALAEELAAEETGGDVGRGKREGGVDEELGGVVAGLGVDVDGAGVVGGIGVVEPPVVGEPAIGLAEGDELSTAGMVEADGALAFVVQDEVDAGDALQEGSDFGYALGVADVDVGDLVVGNGKGFAASGVEVLF